MAQGQLGVIHTDSSYAPAFIPVNIINSAYSIDVLYQDAVDNLEAAELAFYHQFFPEVNTYEAFIAKVREIFNNAENDKNALLSCANAALSDFLPKAKTPVFNQNLQVMVIGGRAVVDTAANIGNVQFTGKIAIDVIPENIGQLKHVFNEVNNLKGNRRYDEKNVLATRNLKREIKKLYDIHVSNQPTSNPLMTTFDITQVTKETYNKDYIQKLIKNSADPAVKQQLAEIRLQAQQSILKMKHFIFDNRLGNASPELKEAAQATWDEIFPKSGISDDVLTKDFWFEGSNYIKSLLGQGGEFFNDTIIRYLQIKTKNTNPKLVQIIGSIIKGGQQPHSDLQIILNLGGTVTTANFQTKNIDSRESVDIKTNAALIQPNFGTDFTSALVNYFTNTDYQAEYNNLLEQVEEVLSQRFFQAMNLNIQPDLDIFQTNTFYLVSGTNIVPCSRIIKDIWSKREQEPPHFEITGKGITNYSKEEYEEGDPPKFIQLKYWKYPKGTNKGPLSASPGNPPAFNATAASISITTSYNFNSLLKNGDFSMFGK